MLRSATGKIANLPFFVTALLAMFSLGRHEGTEAQRHEVKDGKGHRRTAETRTTLKVIKVIMFCDIVFDHLGLGPTRADFYWAG